jgi:FlaA1/EpsC-like NDP-sugar epimerase
MVELNPIEGVVNNILGTYNCVKASMERGVDRFILISTDKAVRPANIMGATKRFSELILQGAQLTGTHTCFSMVRFGNVIDSAGSVVPLFRKQIKAHGPVTVTHPDITRYFMSIEEAVELVIQAGAMAHGGDVFVLEMGEPIKIIELAKKMIYLSGFTPAFGDNPNGDIEIKVTGLRPGEKLFEELLIGENVYSTDHPNIMQAKEKAIKWNEINKMIDTIGKLCKDFDIKKLVLFLQNNIDGYKPADLDYDLIDGKIKLDSLADKLDTNIKGIS